MSTRRKKQPTAEDIANEICNDSSSSSSHENDPCVVYLPNNEPSVQSYSDYDDPDQPSTSGANSLFGTAPFSASFRSPPRKKARSTDDPTWIPASTNVDDSDSSANSNDSDSGNSAVGPTPKRIRSKQRRPELWARNKAKASRDKGEAYKDYKGRDRPARAPKMTDGNCCVRYKCSEKFSDVERRAICASYCAAEGFKMKKAWLLARTTRIQPKRHKTDATKKKQWSYEFHFVKHLDDGSCQNIRICREFLLTTLSISKTSLQRAVAGLGEQDDFVGSDRRGKSEPANKTSNYAKNLVHNHIKSFDVVPPHYVRRDSTRKYLQQGLNKSIMYRLYQKWCDDNNVTTEHRVKEAVYRMIFARDFNLGFYVPKKDQCKICVQRERLDGAERENYDRDIYNPHVDRKVRANSAKSADKEHASESLKTGDGSYRSINFDLQSVLYTPCSAVGPLFYKRKLAVYNFTIYEQITHEGFCFLWNETIAKRGSDEVGSCLKKYLDQLPPSVKHLSMYSDNCYGQNRNSFIALFLLHYVVNSDHLETIDQKFLETGHTYMEVDSMHAAIEHSRKTAINSVQATNLQTHVCIPQNWEIVIANARRKRGTKPYKVRSLQQADFINLKLLKADIMPVPVNIDTTGNRLNMKTVKWLRYKKTHPMSIFYKNDLTDDEFWELSLTGKKSSRSRPPKHPSTVQLQRLYHQLLPISSQKYNDLLDLFTGPASVCDPVYHDFYAKLPHSGRIADCLLEPAQDEDSDSDGTN